MFHRDILELDTNLPQEKVHEATDVIVKQMNSTVTELKRLFLVEDLVDSVKVSGTAFLSIFARCSLAELITKLILPLQCLYR